MSRGRVFEIFSLDKYFCLMLLEALVNVFQAILAHVASFENFLYFLRSRFPSHLAELLLLVFTRAGFSFGRLSLNVFGMLSALYFLPRLFAIVHDVAHTRRLSLRLPLLDEDFYQFNPTHWRFTHLL
jgi:hypothetical protein